MKILLNVSLSLLFALHISTSGYSYATNDSKTILLEITDKYNEVKIGLTESTIYMVFSERVRDIANNNFGTQYQENLQAFEDSDGNFINSSLNKLESNRIEFHINDIVEIKFRNGKLNFVYETKPKIGFEDIYSFNGAKALENFYIEDLEKFILLFSKS